jgi:xanthine dehydrogenase YagR molybdenum-binding subunit
MKPPENTVGQAIDRADARLKVTGAAAYSADVPVANVAYALVVTSAVGSGRIRNLDASDSEHAPGVLRVMTPANAPKLSAPERKLGPVDKVLQLLQNDDVHYNDQPIALVIANSLEHAQHAASLLRIEYEPAALSVDLDAGVSAAYQPAGAGPGAEPDSSRGDVQQGLREAHVQIDRTYHTPNEHHNPMEMHATTAVWQGDQKLTVYDATQGIFNVRKKLAGLFELPEENVRVISHYVGGGFGCKGSAWSHVVLAAMAAREVSRPVKLVLTRQQMFGFVGYRPRTIQRLQLGATADGKLTALAHDSISETSRFDEFAEPCAVTTRMCYRCDNVSTTHRLVRLDVPTPTFTRAPGHATGSFALESAIDELAYALDIDPIELRLRNDAPMDADKNVPWTSKGLRACLERGAAHWGWNRHPRTPRSIKQGDELIGWGVATASYPARRSPASALARLSSDGELLVQTGSQDIGTGTYTIMAQIAADVLRVPLASVRADIGDTVFPPTPVSGGSQTAASTGSAVLLAAQALRDKLIALAIAQPASPLHGLSAAAIEPRENALVARAEPSRRDRYTDIVARTEKVEVSARADAHVGPEQKQYSAHSWGAQFVEVRVDEQLGQVRMSRCLGVFAAGKILNAKTGLSQLQGGMVWGIGMALLEKSVRDPRSGRVTTRDLADYHVPVNADVPPLEVIFLDEIDPHVNPLGAKGIGEVGITGMAAAIANAVHHATGQRVRELPITLDRLL